MTTLASKALALKFLSGPSALEACRVSQWANTCSFKEAGGTCTRDTSLWALTKCAPASTVQAAVDVVSEEVATCLDGKMRAAGYQARGIFVGDHGRTSQNFGGGHTFISRRSVSDFHFRALPEGFLSYLRIVYWPAAPQLPQ